MRYKNRHIKEVLSGVECDKLKALGHIIHDSGLLRYKHLSRENYEYWFKESVGIVPPRKWAYTYSISDLDHTRHTKAFSMLVRSFPDDTCAMTVINTYLQMVNLIYDNQFKEASRLMPKNNKLLLF